MVTNAPVSAPEPSARLVVVVALPHVPVRAHTAPVSLVVAVQSAAPIQMNTDTSVSTPGPTCAPMQTMVVCIAAIQTPIAANPEPSEEDLAAVFVNLLSDGDVLIVNGCKYFRFF